MTRLKQELKQSVDEATQSAFISDEEIQEAKRVLGHLTSNLPEEDLKNAVTEIHFLAESWLDEFERKAFNGKTLNELLSEETKDDTNHK